MFFADHHPPHFHVLGRDGAAQVAIDGLAVLGVRGRIDLRDCPGLGGGSRPVAAGEVAGTERRRAMSIGRLTRLEVTGATTLRLDWDDGGGAVLDLGTVARRRPSLASLLDPQVFAAAAVSDDGWSVEWPSGVDFGSVQLQRWAAEQTNRSDAA